MTITSILPLIAAILFLFFLVYRASVPDSPEKRSWLLPAALSALFFGFSLVAVFTEGPTGFWPEHTRNLWGNQIWFDLLLAVGVGWYFLVPPAKSVGMRPLPWLVLVVCTGSIGLLAMLARLLYLQEKAANRS
ncbi:MAG: hypothetical protein Kow0031_13000 [Anaerolineae bacterium]